jgi:hypothetical protein
LYFVSAIKSLKELWEKLPCGDVFHLLLAVETGRLIEAGRFVGGGVV